MKKKKEVNVALIYNKILNFIKEKEKIFTSISVGLVVIIGIFVYYKYYYLAPLEEEAKIEIYYPQTYFELDSFNLAMYGDKQGHYGFQQIIENYGTTKTGNLAQYYMGLCLLRTGKFQEAIDYMKEYSGEDPLVYANCLGNIGDAYTELEDYTNSITYYNKAIKQGDNNFIAPRYLMKIAKISEFQGNKEEALTYYTQIKKQYPNSIEGREIEKYIAKLK